MKATASGPCKLVEPTKIANASVRLIERDAIRIASENENTIPTFENVRSIPEEMPNSCGGEAFITAELLPGKKKPAPTPLAIEASTTSHSPVCSESCA